MSDLSTLLQAQLAKLQAQKSALEEVSANKTMYNAKAEQIEAVANPNNQFSEPTTPYAPKYPYNNAKQTESGHLMEFDDTPGAERVSIGHRTGTFYEIHPDGSMMEKIVNDNYQIIMKDDYIQIQGKATISVQGACKVLVNGNAQLQFNGDVNLKVGGNMNMAVDGSFTATAKDFNFVGPINQVGNFKTTGNILTQSNISANLNIVANQDIKSYANVIDSVRSMADDRQIYDGHTHNVPGDVTDTPNQQE
jgi:hypothetical protein